MAVHDSTQSQSAPSFAPVGSAPNMQSQAQAAPVQGWQGLGSLSGVISYSQGSAQLQKLKEKIDELFKNVQGSIKVETFALDNTQLKGIYYSSIVLTMRDANSSKMTAYTMLLAGSKIAPTSRTEQILGQNVEIKVVPGEVFDQVYVERMRDYILSKVKVADFAPVGGCIVPADFNIEDSQAVRNLAYNAQCATYLELIGAEGVDIAKALSRDTTLSVGLDFNRTVAKDAVGAPIRADISVAFTAGSAHTPGSNQSLNNQTGNNDIIGCVTGFVNVLWAPVQPQQWGMYNPVMDYQNTQKYAAQFVMTQLESKYAPVLETFLLLLISTTPLASGNEWYQTFYNSSRFATKSVDFTDIGYLNVEANLPNAKNPAGNPNGIGDRVDTKGKDFTIDKFATYMQRLFRPGLLFSLDIPLCGPSTAFLDVFRAAANNNSHARQAILEAASKLTNQDLVNNFKGKIFAESGNIVHLGDYEKDGEKRDIRDVDHLAAVVKWAETDLQLVRKWSDTFLQTSIPIQKRLADRWNMIQAITGNKANLTGLAERVTFTDEFLTTLCSAVTSNGLRMRLDLPASALGMQVDRGVAGFVTSALVNQAFSPIFQQGFNTSANPEWRFNTQQWRRF